MLDMTTKAPTLVAGDVHALRKCDDWVFFHMHGRSWIEAIKRPDDTEPFEQKRRVYCDCSFIDYEDNTSSMQCRTLYTGFTMMSARRDTIETIAGLLRKGDTIALRWERGSKSSPMMTEKGMVGDTLKLRIHRGDKVLTFVIEMQNAESGSGSRMVRKA